MHSNVNHAEPTQLTFMGIPNYSNALEANGAAAVFVPLQLGDESLRAIYDRLDGLMLAGGEDVHPAEYGEEVAPYCGLIDPMRDAAELTLVRWAFQDRKPLL